MVGRALAGVRIDLVAERGVDGGIVDQQAQLLRQAGATVTGVVWLEESWKLTDASQLTALRGATGLTNRTPTPLRLCRSTSPPPRDRRSRRRSACSMPPSVP